MSNTVTCPYCTTPRKVTQNMEFKCSGCGARIKTDNNAEIKAAYPKK